MELSSWIRMNAPWIRFGQNVSMKQYTTFRVGGNAAMFAEAENEEELKTLLTGAQECSTPWLLIGNGSDLLFRDEGYAGLVIRLTGKFCYTRREGNHICCGAGEMMSRAARFACDEGLTGMEFMSGIPGSIGGGVYMNAGAYGGEISGIIETAVCMTYEGSILNIEKEDMRMGYRQTVFMEKPLIILHARFALSNEEPARIRETMHDLNLRRREKQPLEFPSAGSFFKRPEGHFAGALIEQSGLKGMKVGDAEVSEKHAGFIINRGNATCSDILQLMKQVQDRVYDQHQVHLEPEVQIVGGTI